MTAHHETYLKSPSLPAMGLGALWPSAGWNSREGFPTFSFIWRDYQISTDLISALRRLAGRDDEVTTERLQLLAPHVSGFRLTLAMLMHPDWPLPVWQALQLRNRLIRNGAIKVAYPSDLIARATAWRVHDKGIELDIHAQLLQDDDCPWESVTTFYYRGRFAPPLNYGPLEGATAVSPSVNPDLAPVAHWTVDGDHRLRFARLTGDCNPLHLIDAYARRTGFAAASAHPQRIAAQCLGHLTLSQPPRQLDLWLKGPVYYNRGVTLRQTHSAEGEEFALWVDGDERAAMVGRLS
ncbi:acyl dehydratase [Rhodopseudomonas sp.]|uniref:acyl dehydratase n=1 Tax=Rhodopseudomonas sp. TaxID=1078 RepID=UPI003B3B6C92